jgi:hypothetical protein
MLKILDMLFKKIHGFINILIAKLHIGGNFEVFFYLL